MAWSFADGFDCYATPADATGSYWDVSTATGINLVAGRFAGSQAFSWNGIASQTLVKTSSVNDAVHHLVVAFRQTAAISGTTLGLYLQLLDGATAQCSVVFRSDGAILLTAGAANGTVLATYSGAFPVTNTWYAFEIEVAISNTAGWMKVRKNGNTTEDFTSSLTLDTQASANAYANKLQIAEQATLSTQQLDDLFWRSDASSVAWLGDIRCTTRMPASDASVQWSRAPTNYQQSTNGGMGAGSGTPVANQIVYIQFTATYTGSVGSLTLTCSTTSSANWKCALYNNAGSGGSPGTVLGTATPFSAPGVGAYTINFPTPVAVTAGSIYWVGIGADVSSGQFRTYATGTTYYIANSAYAAFPVNNPAVSSFSGAQYYFTVNYSPANNYMMVAEAQQDTTTSYVYDSTVGHEDYYGIAAIASTPLTTHMITTRAYMQKSDAGTRTAAVQLKSGASVVASPTLVLTTSGWQWAWRSDTTDPATSGAWTAAAVNNVQCGPKVIA